MMKLIAYILLTLFLSVVRLQAQADLDPPVAPVLELVSVDHLTGNVEISWSRSPSPDVSGYVVYLYKNNEGYELDTIYNPAATSYLRTGSGSGYYSESFVVAALDTAENISPLSNMLSTVYASVQIDTCNKRVEVSWNSYSSVPKEVTEYWIYYSVNAGSFADSMKVGPEHDNSDIGKFYCRCTLLLFRKGFSFRRIILRLKQNMSSDKDAETSGMDKCRLCKSSNRS